MASDKKFDDELTPGMEVHADAVLAIDPGPTQSALLVFNGNTIAFREILNNPAAAEIMRQARHLLPQCTHLAIEKIECYGMPVGMSVFETAFWSGRFAEACRLPCTRIGRKEITLHLCNSVRAKDANIRQALIDRWGGKEAAIGKKKSPGPLYGVKSHLWSALAVAVTWWDLYREQKPGQE